MEDYLGGAILVPLLDAFETAVKAAVMAPSPHAHGVREGLWQALQAVALSDADIGALEREITLGIRKPRSHRKAEQARLTEETTL